MSIINKTQALDFVNTPIQSATDNTSNLKPTNGFPIKYTNFSSFWKDFIEYLFPTVPNNVDLHGKSPIFRNTDSVGNYTETNSNYSNLTYQEIVPIGGIIMYGKAGVNSSATIDGYLYCDGSKYNMTLNTNFKYKRLYDIIGQSFHNPNNIDHGTTPVTGWMYLPDMRSKSAIGYDSTAFNSPRTENGIINNTNGIGNMGGKNTNTLLLDNLPSHSHNIQNGVNGVSLFFSTRTTSDGSHQHEFNNAFFSENGVVVSSVGGVYPYGFNASNPTLNSSIIGPTIGVNAGAKDTDNNPVAFLDKTRYDGTHFHDVTVSDSKNNYTLSGKTNNAGSGQAITNRSAYVVVNYIIKY